MPGQEASMTGDLSLGRAYIFMMFFILLSHFLDCFVVLQPSFWGRTSRNDIFYLLATDRRGQ
ncbi:hypothetical protein ES703_20505 [subsurface metagenome]